jgi:hypothetical protein
VEDSSRLLQFDSAEMASIETEDEPMKPQPLPGGAGRRLSMFLWETLHLIMAWIPGLLRTGAEEVSFQMSPMRSPALINTMLAGLPIFVFWHLAWRHGRRRNSLSSSIGGRGF